MVVLPCVASAVHILPSLRIRQNNNNNIILSKLVQGLAISAFGYRLQR